MGGSFRYVLICVFFKNCLVIEKNISIHVQGKGLCKQMRDLCPQQYLLQKLFCMSGGVSASARSKVCH